MNRVRWGCYSVWPRTERDWERFWIWITTSCAKRRGFREPRVKVLAQHWVHSVTRPGQQGGLGPHLWSALKVTANNESRMSHDFRSHPLASIPFQVVVENPTSEGAAFAYKVSSCDDTPSSSVFVGCTQANLTVPANQVWSLTTIFFSFHSCNRRS